MYLARQLLRIPDFATRGAHPRQDQQRPVGCPPWAKEALAVRQRNATWGPLITGSWLLRTAKAAWGAQRRAAWPAKGGEPLIRKRAFKSPYA